MTMISHVLGRAAAWGLRVLFAVAALLFTVSLLVALAVIVTMSLLWSLVTGRKAAPTVLWQRYRQASAQARWAGRMAPRGGRMQPVEVVDVQAREVRTEGRPTGPDRLR